MAAAAKELPACPVETTLTLISDKWKVLILRDLMPGTKRFGELKKSIGSVSQKVLPAQLREIPLYRSPAAAGFASPVFGEDYDLIEVGGDVPAGADFAVRLQGDSMEPWLHDGGLAYVNRDPLQNGDVGIFCVDGEMLCKQYYRDPLGMVYLFSLNRARSDADVVLPRDSGRSLVCMGRVLLPRRPALPQ